MECTNKHCLWNFADQCCHESEDGYKKAVPNELNCPSSIRKDFEEQLNNIFNECASLLKYRTMKELIQIKKFIESQRD